MAKDNNLSPWKKSDLENIFAVGLVAFVILSAFPLLPLGRLKNWSDFGALATWIYVLITFFTLLALVGAAYLGLKQLGELDKTRKFSLLQEVYKSYRDENMGRAIRTVWNCPSEKFQPNTQEDDQRRLVSDFWNWLGWLHLQSVASLDVIDSRFQDGVEICDKLTRLELSLRLRLERQRHEKWSEEQRMYAATDYVANLPLVKLYNKWSEKYGPKYKKEYLTPGNGTAFKEKVQNAKTIEDLHDTVQETSILPAQFCQLVTYHMERLKQDPFCLASGDYANQIGNAFGIADKLKELVGIKELREEELPVILRNELQDNKNSLAEKGVGFKLKKVRSSDRKYLITIEKWFGAGTGLQYVEEQEITVTLDEGGRIKEKLQSLSIDRMEIGDMRI